MGAKLKRTHHKLRKHVKERVFRNKKIEKNKFLAKGGIFLILAKLVFSFMAFYASSDSLYAGGISTEDLLNCTNYYREQEAGIAPLVLNPDLSRAAVLKLDDMDKYNYWAHQNPETGAEPWKFLDQIQYNYIVAGENLAFDYNTSDGVCKGWMNSTTHRENLLNRDYQEVGFAMRRVNLEENGEGILIVQFFGTRPGVSIDQALLDKYSYKSQNVACRTEISDKLKINSPECGFVNEPKVELEAEILDDAFQNTSFKINESDLEGKVLDEGGHKIIRAERELSDGDYKITTDSPAEIDEAVVSFTVDTSAPQVDENQIKVIDDVDENSYIFEINVPIEDDNFDSAKIYYDDALGENTAKDLHLLGDNVYNVRISFLKNAEKLDLSATIVALDKANNSTNLSLDFYPPEDSFSPVAASAIDWNEIWKYLLIAFVSIVVCIYLLDLYVFHEDMESREHKHHNFAQMIIFVLILISLVSFS